MHPLFLQQKEQHLKRNKMDLEKVLKASGTYQWLVTARLVNTCIAVSALGRPATFTPALKQGQQCSLRVSCPINRCKVL